jgi:HAMP domain-containing protein
MTTSRHALVIALWLGGGVAALAQAAPDTENGRYALSPAADGVLRLDTRSGAMAVCSDKGTGWACLAMPDERAALDAEIGRLQRENDALKTDNATLRRDAAQLRDQLASRDVPPKIEQPLPKQDQLRAPEIKSERGERKIEIPLPSDRDIDRVMGLLEHAWKRLIEMAQRVQKDSSGKI